MESCNQRTNWLTCRKNCSETRTVLQVCSAVCAEPYARLRQPAGGGMAAGRAKRSGVSWEPRRSMRKPFAATVLCMLTGSQPCQPQNVSEGQRGKGTVQEP